MTNELRRTIGVSFLAFVLGVLACESATAQVVMADGQIDICEGIFRDDGNNGAYTGAELTMTICPDNVGDVIAVEFLAFNIFSTPVDGQSAYLSIYDGDSDGALSLGSYTGSQLQGLTVSATIANASGCLTFEFSSPLNNPEGLPGWEGSIQCGTPCANPTAAAEILGDWELINNIPTASICTGESVVFGDAGSSVDPGFAIEDWIWNFDDGTLDTLGAADDVSHLFNEPGAYTVQLVVEYFNGSNDCSSLNLDPVQVFVSTQPQFNTEVISPICTGATTVSAAVDGSPLIFELWSDAPDFNAPSISPTGFDAGFTYCSELLFDIFAADAILENCEDLIQIDAFMEHSYLGDLQIDVSCPDGTTVTLQTQGGGGTFLGEPVDVEDDLTPGECYQYGWSESSTLGQIEDAANSTATTYVDAAGNNATGNIVNPGVYEPENTLCDLVGCPLNGTWEFCFTDFLGLDNGFVCTWNLVLNPELIPGVTIVQPTIVSAAWDTSPYTGSTDIIVATNPDEPWALDVIANEPGVYPFTFTVENSFGCVSDTTISIEAVEPPNITAGEDIFACGETQLQAAVLGLPEPVCGDDSGLFTYCYESSVNVEFTYCPDEPNNGSTFMSIEFLAGSVENIFDEFYIYDGPDTGSPLLTPGNYYGNAGDLTGLSWTATNATGCLTMALTPDGSVDCNSSENIQEWEYVVACTNASGINWNWTPAGPLSSANGPSPTVFEITEPTTFTVEAEWTSLPGCATTDQVMVSPAFDIDYGTEDPTCFGNDGSVTVEILSNGSVGPWNIVVLVDGEFAGQAFTTTGGATMITNLPPGAVTMTVEDGFCTIEDDWIFPVPPGPALLTSLDTTICINGQADLLASINEPADNVAFHWGHTGDTAGLQPVTPNSQTTYTVFASYEEGCITEQAIITVDLYDPLALTMSTPETICSEDTAWVGVTDVFGGLEPYDFAWTGAGAGMGAGFGVSPDESTEFCVTVTDVCETPAVTGCVEIAIPESLTPEFEADMLSGCFPITVTFEGLEENTDLIASALWDFGDGNTSTALGNAVHTYIQEGTWNVSLAVVSTAGCAFYYDVPAMISTYDWPYAEFSADPTITALPDTRFEFENYSLNYATSDWDFGGLGASTETNPTYTFPDNQSGEYTVTLVVSNPWGCADTVSHSVLVNESFTMYIPSGFTPDMDGLNDAWTFHGIDVDADAFHLRVWDRWGLVVFETHDLNAAWLGDYMGGDHFVPNDVYTYLVISRSQATGERKEITGTVTLAR